MCDQYRNSYLEGMAIGIARSDGLVDENRRLRLALKLARRIMKDFGLWNPDTPDTDKIRAALRPSERKLLK